MKNIKDFLTMIFRDISASDILGNLEKVCYNRLDTPEILKLMERNQKHYSRNELRAQLAYFQDICEDYNQRWALRKLDGEERALDIFSLLFYYVSGFLTFRGNEVCCNYINLLHWRMMTLEMSEDMLICAFLADYDAKEHIYRNIFDWPVVIGHNNMELNMILNQGMAENHFHLKGGAPAFHLAWCYLMNNRITDEDRKKLQEMELRSRNVTHMVSLSHTETTMEDMISLAATIRMYLFHRLTNIKIVGLRHLKKEDTAKKSTKENETEEDIIALLQSKDFYSNFKTMGELVYESIVGFRMLMMQFNGEYLDDYAVVEKRGEKYSKCEMSNSYPANAAIYRGERHFLYLAFMAIRMRYTLNEWEKNLFFAYLVIRERFRRELLQNNYKSVGFENFSIFEERKSYFTNGNVLAREAMQEALFFPGIHFLEARICPKDTVEANAEMIRQVDNSIDESGKYREKFGYIVHFVKKEDKSLREQKKNIGNFICRHQSLRKEINDQANAIIGLREKYPNYAKRIVGIDACNQEIGCRPEVFATVFRKLKKHTVREIGQTKNTYVPQLKITYHVGEDFLDPLDGLRAIDEAIYFLQMGCGDRLGHALALGIDTDEWYDQKVKIILPCQDYLDNIVWLYFALSDYNIEGMDNLKIHLEEEFHELFNKIYRPFIRKAMLDKIVEAASDAYSESNSTYYYGCDFRFDIYHYYKSCQLRGDDPEYYIKGYFENVMSDDFRKNPHNINWNFPEKFDARMIPEAAILYYYYHYDANVKNAGAKYMSKKPHPDYIKAVRILQKKMQKKVALLGICIEANPTSNFMIGTFKRYDKHPIIKWFNRSLETDPEVIENCAQLSVSINTDDMGVFSTRLDNEYSLMALALERVCDEKGRRVYDKNTVYRWINDIREFGLRQNFVNQNRQMMPGIEQQYRGE